MDVFFGNFPSSDRDKTCENANETGRNMSSDGDCYGTNFSVLCISVHIFSLIIVIVNLFVLTNGILAVRKKLVKSIRTCEFYLILNLAFADMMTGVLTLIILGWDFTLEVQLKFKKHLKISHVFLSIHFNTLYRVLFYILVCI